MDNWCTIDPQTRDIDERITFIEGKGWCYAISELLVPKGTILVNGDGQLGVIVDTIADIADNGILVGETWSKWSKRRER